LNDRKRLSGHQDTSSQRPNFSIRTSIMLRSTKKLLLWLLLLGLLILNLLSSSLEATVLTPELQSVLSSLSDQDEISVIITLSDKIDPRQIRDGGKSLLRSKIIKALRNKADVAQAPLKVFLEGRGARKLRSLWLINGMAVTAKPDVVRELTSFPGIEEIKLDETIQAPVVVQEVSAIPEWNLSAIRAPELWALGYTGEGVVVASMDTGVDVNHPDLQSGWRGGTNSWFDPNGQHSTPFDADGHGTATMGVMLGGDAGGTAIGVAPGARWIAVKIFNDSGTATFSGIHEGFQWLLDPDGDPGTDDAPHVVNNSWGLDSDKGCSLEFEPDIHALKVAGIAVVFAGGNSGPSPSTSISPANNPDGFAVGAVDQSLAIYWYSSRGPSACDGRIYPEVVAPGVLVKTSILSSGFASVTGTSIAAPHVAGAMALLLNAFPQLTVPEVELALKHSAFDIGTPGTDNDSGYGLLDVLAAYQLILNPVANISVSPASHLFGTTKEGSLSIPHEFMVRNVGLGDLVMGSVSKTGADPSEFVIQSDGCSGQTLVPLGTCFIQVAFSPLSGGSKSTNLSLSSNDPDQNPFDVALNGTGIEQYNLSVIKTGDGTGQVVGITSGIDCGTDCIEDYDPGKMAVLTAKPDAESAFGGWSGCSWSFGRQCRVLINMDKSITSTFIGPSLSISSPNGGEEWKPGTLKKIIWDHTGRPGAYVRIELLKGDILHSTIASRAWKGFNGKGTRYWRLPKDLPDGIDYKIRITSTKNSAHTDTSDGFFSITP
jgi:bacillopeptidase F